MRPGVASWIAAAKLAVAASSRWVSSGFTNRVIRRAATPRTADVSSAVATEVTRSTSSWASSTTSSACSGSTADSATASMASSAWLVTTMSAPPARPRARSEKHSEPNGQRATPRHSRAETLTWDQDRSGTPGFRSSRSPESVVDAQAVSRCTSRPRAVAAIGSKSSSCGPSPASSSPQRHRCESCSGTDSFDGL